MNKNTKERNIFEMNRLIKNYSIKISNDKKIKKKYKRRRE